MRNKQGFSLIELVIVVVILGLLAATALPRFLNITEDAEDASLEGVAGGFASAVSLVKAQWEIEGRPTGNADITLDGTIMDVGTTGFPTGLSSSNADEATMEASDCLGVWVSIMQSPPPATTQAADTNNRYFISSRRVEENGLTTTLCYYYLIATLDVQEGQSITVTAGNEPANNTFNYFTYNSRTGQVAVVNNS